MLATIVCVFGRDMETFLPKDDSKYDSYLIHYGQLLHAWNKLYTRLEFLNHLSSRYSENNWKDGSHINQDVEQNQKYPPIERGSMPEADMNLFAELKVAENRSLGAEQYKQFRCSICHNTVRGLIMICKSCGHGGHGKCNIFSVSVKVQILMVIFCPYAALHIKSWFKDHSECPTGCGCSCKFSTQEIGAKELPLLGDDMSMPRSISHFRL